jgi:hypothetical protein
VLQAVPALIGVFVGGPLLARELETGTSRFAWTQGCGRLRWTISKLLPLAALVTAGAIAVSLVTTCSGGAVSECHQVIHATVGQCDWRSSAIAVCSSKTPAPGF